MNELKQAVNGYVGISGTDGLLSAFRPIIADSIEIALQDKDLDSFTTIIALYETEKKVVKQIQELNSEYKSKNILFDENIYGETLEELYPVAAKNLASYKEFIKNEPEKQNLPINQQAKEFRAYHASKHQLPVKKSVSVAIEDRETSMPAVLVKESEFINNVRALFLKEQDSFNANYKAIFEGTSQVMVESNKAIIDMFKQLGKFEKANEQGRQVIIQKTTITSALTNSCAEMVEAKRSVLGIKIEQMNHLKSLIESM